MTKKEDTKTCPITPCSLKGFLLPTIVVFGVIFIFELLFHGNLMRPHYLATASLWRGPEEIESLFHISLIRTIIASSIIVILYNCICKVNDASCCVSGTKFGLLIGLLLGIWDFGAYSYLPIPMEIALSWLLGNIVMGMLIGISLKWLNDYMCKS